jgi:pimeloyl-ACP methyl ester carboxylesterase
MAGGIPARSPRTGSASRGPTSSSIPLYPTPANTVCRVANRRQSAIARAVVGIGIALLCASAPGRGQEPGIFYEADGEGLPVVFVPDWAHDTGSWFRLLPHLRSERRRLIRYDLRGQGRSEIPADGDYALSAHEADLLRLLDGLGIERAHLVGVGLGAAIALRFTLQHPDRVLSVAAVDPRLAWGEGERDDWERLLGAWERIGRPTLGEYTSVLVERWVGTRFAVANPWVVPWYDLMLRRQSAAALIASMRAGLAGGVDLSAASAVDTPALVVVGENWSGGGELQAMEAAFPRLWRDRLEDSAAQPAVDAPEALAEQLEEFLAGTGS